MSKSIKLIGRISLSFSENKLALSRNSSVVCLLFSNNQAFLSSKREVFLPFFELFHIIKIFSLMVNEDHRTAWLTAENVCMSDEFLGFVRNESWTGALRKADFIRK